MVQHFATRIAKHEVALSEGLIPLAGNFLVFIASVGIICFAVYTYAFA